MKLLLADDHTLVRQGLIPFFRLLDEAVEVIEASDLEEALALVAAAPTPPPDLVLLDLRMPGMNGTEGLRRMKSALGTVPVVILSGSIEAADVMACVEAGAAGYLPKTLSSTAMINALRLVLSGECYFPSFALTRPPEPSPGVASYATENPLGDLEEREKAILGMVITGMTNKEIARTLELQEVTIKVQTRNIYRKLGAANRSQAVRIAMENGWKC